MFLDVSIKAGLWNSFDIILRSMEGLGLEIETLKIIERKVCGVIKIILLQGSHKKLTFFQEIFHKGVGVTLFLLVKCIIFFVKHFFEMFWIARIYKDIFIQYCKSVKLVHLYLIVFRLLNHSFKTRFLFHTHPYQTTVFVRMTFDNF